MSLDFNITVLGSGSSGNSVLFTVGDKGLLIDAGFSRKELLRRLDKVGVSPEVIKAILITHEHTDHVKGARVLANYLDVPTYVTYETGNYLSERNKIGDKKTIFESGTSFKFLDFLIQTFNISHDALDPVGFIISYKGINVGYALDTGHLNTLTKCRLRGCDAIILECNYDAELLRNSQRPIRLIRRVASKFGHLSNDEAVSSFDELLTNKTRHLFLGHISGECNKYDLVEDMARSKLDQLEKKDIQFSTMYQDTPKAPLLLG